MRLFPRSEFLLFVFLQANKMTGICQQVLWLKYDDSIARCQPHPTIVILADHADVAVLIIVEKPAETESSLSIGNGIVQTTAKGGNPHSPVAVPHDVCDIVA